MTLQYTEGVEAFTLAPFTGILGWTKEEVEVFNIEVRKHAKDRSIHTLHNLYVSLFVFKNQSRVFKARKVLIPFIAISYMLRGLVDFAHLFGDTFGLVTRAKLGQESSTSEGNTNLITKSTSGPFLQYFNATLGLKWTHCYAIRVFGCSEKYSDGRGVRVDRRDVSRSSGYFCRMVRSGCLTIPP